MEDEMWKVIATRAGAAVIIIRLMVGGVFVSEGVQKFLYPAEVGAGRFEKIGFPRPELVAPFVGCFEIGCGALVLVGLWTRVAAVPLLIVICTAIATTKVPMLVNQGFWKMAHEARTDWSMLLGLVFLLVVGGGAWSVDGWFGRRSGS
jgi:uncharacterized membrane protein YphA (DoxX/SURF4 family)